MNYLLDKVVARTMAQALLKVIEGASLSFDEAATLSFWQQARLAEARLLVVPPTVNILQRISSQPRYTATVQLLLAGVEPVYPTSYYKRWARRLRGFGFTREDAAVLALGTFGVDAQHELLRVDAVVTLDQRMIHNWQARAEEIATRLRAMTHDLEAPYSLVGLPQLWLPDQVTL